MAASSVPELRIQAADANALFDDVNRPAYPHVGRLLNPRISGYLEGLAREQRKSPQVSVRITLRSPALGTVLEEKVGRQVHAYFEEERALADLDVRVNRVEAMGSFRFGIPLIAAALAIAGLFYFAQADYSSAIFATYATALLYLFFITVVWVLLWDPIEALLFTSYFLRARRSALDKLRTAAIRFDYSGPAVPS